MRHSLIAALRQRARNLVVIRQSQQHGTQGLYFPIQGLAVLIGRFNALLKLVQQGLRLGTFKCQAKSPGARQLERQANLVSLLLPAFVEHHQGAEITAFKQIQRTVVDPFRDPLRVTGIQFQANGVKPQLPLGKPRCSALLKCGGPVRILLKTLLLQITAQHWME